MRKGGAWGSSLHLRVKEMRRSLQEKTWMDNLWRQHIIYIPRMVHGIDGEKWWSPVSINAATGGSGSARGRNVKLVGRRILKYSQNFFSGFLHKVKVWFQCEMIPNRLYIAQLSLAEWLDFHKTSSIDESTLWSIDSRGGITLHYIHNPIWLWFVRCSVRFDGNNCL